MQGGLVTAEDAVDLLAGPVIGAAKGDPVGTNMLEMGEQAYSLATEGSFWTS